MATEGILPKLGQTMEEGTIVEWFKQEGDEVKRGEILFTVESDKATLEAESPGRGILRKILVPEGETVPVLTVVGVITRTADEELSGFGAPGAVAVAEVETAADALAARGITPTVADARFDQCQHLERQYGPGDLPVCELELHEQAQVGVRDRRQHDRRRRLSGELQAARLRRRFHLRRRGVRRSRQRLQCRGR